MQLTPDQITTFTTRAKQAGYSDAEIQQEIARKTSEAQTAATPSPSAPVAPQQLVAPQAPQIQPQQQSSVAGSVGRGAITGAKSAASVVGSIAMNAPKFALDLAKEFVNPAVKGAKTIASAGEEAIQTGQYLAGNKKAFNSPILPDSIKLSPQEINQIRNHPLEEAVKQSAGIGSYAIPFGKAGFIGSKAIVPGAAVAASRSVSNGDTPEEVLGNAIIGGTTAGALQLGGKVLSSLKGGAAKTAVAAESGANALEQGTRQIRVKPSIYGASKEKAINETLDRLGFKGSPQNQYENLQPAMNKLEGQVQDFIAKNPNISVPKASIKESFITSLKSSLRSGEITEKQAVSETNKYLGDLVKASGGTGKFTNIPLGQLRNLKKLVNEDYGPIKKILDNGGNLSPKQRVIAVARDSLDNAVKTSAPEVKSLLTDESHLYDAARSLSGARSNPPVLRAMSTSVPQPVTQLIRDTAKEGLRTTANAASAMSKVLPTLPSNPALTYIAGQTASILPSLGRTPPSLNEVPNESQNTIGTNQGQIQTNSDQYNTHNDSITQQPKYLNQWGASPQDLYREYQNAYQYGDIKTAAYLSKVYNDEMAYQKTNAPKAAKPLSSQQVKDVNLAKNGQRGLDVVKKELGYNDVTGTVGPDAVNKVSQLRLIPFGLGNRKLKKAIFDAAGARLRIESGAALSPDEIKRYVDNYIAQIGDNPDAINYEIQQLTDFLNGIATQQSDVPSINYNVGSQGLGATPDMALQ